MVILQIKFAALVDVRCVKQSNPDAMPAVTNRVDQALRVDDKGTASSLISSSNNKPNLSKDPSSGNAFSHGSYGYIFRKVAKLMTSRKLPKVCSNSKKY